MQTTGIKGSSKAEIRQPSAKHTEQSHSCKLQTSNSSKQKRAVRRLGSVLQVFLALSLLSALLYCVLYSMKLYL